MRIARWFVTFWSILIAGACVTTAPAMAANAPVPPDEIPRAAGEPVAGIATFVPMAAGTLSLPFTFEHPQNWRVGEQRHEEPPYQQILILGPRNAADTFTVGVTVRVLPVKTRGGEYAGLQELAAWRRMQYAGAAGFRSIRDEVASRFGGEGRELEFQYDTRVSRGTAGAVSVTLKHHVVLLSRKDALCEFAFSADALEYDLYHPAFARLLESVRFLR